MAVGHPAIRSRILSKRSPLPFPLRSLLPLLLLLRLIPFLLRFIPHLLRFIPLPLLLRWLLFPRLLRFIPHLLRFIPLPLLLRSPLFPRLLRFMPLPLLRLRRRAMGPKPKSSKNIKRPS